MSLKSTHPLKIPGVEDETFFHLQCDSSCETNLLLKKKKSQIKYFQEPGCCDSPNQWDCEDLCCPQTSEGDFTVFFSYFLNIFLLIWMFAFTWCDDEK